MLLLGQIPRYSGGPVSARQSSIRITILITLLLYAIFSLVSRDKVFVPVEARFKRCFTCRSRGALGDCRDPFNFNSTTFDGQINHKPSIEATPCASGWCAKIIEDDFGESIAATERSCMTRPPTDNEERCSETIFENHKDRKVYLCMCYGDLCNSATNLLSNFNNYRYFFVTITLIFSMTTLSNSFL